MSQIVRPTILKRESTGWRNTNRNFLILDSDDAPPGWQSAKNARNFDDLHDYYGTIVGHNPATDMREYTGNVNMTEDWLVNGQGGHVTETASGWLVEAIAATGTIRPMADNITLTDFHMLNGTALYGLQTQTVASLGRHARNFTAEYGTLNGNNTVGSTAINFGESVDPGNIKLRFIDALGFRAGYYCFGGATIEYCRSYGLHYTPESHNTAASIRARNVTFRRCLLEDGNSSALSFYAENSPYTGLLALECMFRLPEGDTGPEVIMAKQYSTPQPGETREIVDCLFYRGGNIGGGGIAGDTIGFTTLSGNIDRNGDPVAA